MDIDDISIIVVNWNSFEYLQKMVKNIISEKTGCDLIKEIIIVDNNSPKGDSRLLEDVFKEISMVKIIKNSKNMGFSKACNKAAQLAEGKYLLFLNPDIEISVKSIEKLYRFLKDNPEVGIVGPKVIGRDGQLQLSACKVITPFTIFIGGPMSLKLLNKFGVKPRIIGCVYNSHEHEKTLFPDWIVGACLLLSKALFFEVGGFDERFFMYCEDMDLCWRIKKSGYLVAYYPASVVIHYGGESAKQVPEATVHRRIRSEFLFFKKYKGNTVALFSIFSGIVGNLLKAGLALCLRRDKCKYYISFAKGYATFLKEAADIICRN